MQCFCVRGQPARCPSIRSQTHEIKEQFDGIAERALVPYLVVAVLLPDIFTLILNLRRACRLSADIDQWHARLEI